MGERHVYHANSNELSNGKPKQPASTRIGMGEIAINYKEGYETMFIKNDRDGIVSFSNDGTKTDINANVTIPTVIGDVSSVASTSIVTIGKNVRNTEESITIDCGVKSEGDVFITSVNGDKEHEVQLATHEQLVDGLSDYYTKQEADLLYDEKVDKDEQATTTTYGVVKLNPNGSVTLNEHGQLVIKGILGQSTDGGLYYPVDSDPTKVGNCSLLLSEAKGLSVAHRSLIVAGGINITLKTAANPGATQYRIPNNQDNRFFCSAFLSGRLALNEASAKTLTVPITSVKFEKTGENVYQYHGGTENDNDIIITVSQTLNPDSTITVVRGYGRWTSADTMSIGQGNAATTGKLLQVGQANVSSGTQNLMVGIRNYSTASSSIMIGSTNINKQTYSCTIGQGHDNSNGRSGIALFGTWSVPSTQTLFAIGDGTGPGDRKNIFEITKGNNNETGIVFRAPNGNTYKLSVDNNGNLITTAV